jgi:hypothetical protein
MTTPADVDSKLAAILAPVAEQAAQLDELIAAKEAELLALRESRRAIKRVLTAADPTTKPGPKNGAVQHVAKPVQVSVAVRGEVTNWLRQHAEDREIVDGFTAAALWRHPDFDATGSDATCRNALLALRDDGIIRLDRAGPGGSKIYKLVQ